jgi:hypothetical protein
LTDIIIIAIIMRKKIKLRPAHSGPVEDTIDYDLPLSSEPFACIGPTAKLIWVKIYAANLSFIKDKQLCRKAKRLCHCAINFPAVSIYV